ncbi:MAG: efflux RND transporter periplasmic adaptor subunit [Oscillospiraceae bacterium]
MANTNENMVEKAVAVPQEDKTHEGKMEMPVEATPVKKEKVKKPRKKGWLRNRILAGAVILVILALVVNWVVGLVRGPLPVVVEAQAVETGNVNQVLNTSGVLTTGEQITVYAPVSAPISAVNIEVGARVEAGDLMFAFDTVMLERNYRNASAAAGISSIQAQQAKDAGKEAEQNVVDSQANIDNLYVQRDKAQSTLNNLLAQQQTAQQAAAALKTAWEDALAVAGNDATDPAVIAAKRAYDEAAAVVSATQAQVSVAQADVQDQMAKLSAAQQTNAAAKAGVLDENQNKSLSLQQVSPQTAFETARDSLNAGKAGVAAPISGVITSVAVNEGGAASQYAPMCVIESTEQVNVVVSLSRYDLERVKEGQTATVTSLGKQYEAVVGSIDAYATQSATGSNYVKAKVSIKNPDSALHLGLGADVSIETGMAQDVTLLPIMAVNTNVDGNHCFVIEDGVAVRRDVVLGLSSDTNVEVISGVQEGDMVIISSQNLSGGEKVTAGQLADTTGAFTFQMGRTN